MKSRRNHSSGVPTAINQQRLALPKTPTGIPGLDEITFGGLPKGRSTLIAPIAIAAVTKYLNDAD
jgi:hypothetical protein